MCKNLVEKGNLDKPLIIFNRTQKRAIDISNSLRSGRSIVASSLGEAVSQADVIFTCVGDDAAVLQTIEGALKADVRSKLFVDCSTVHPDTTSKLEEIITEAKAEFVACPVFGRYSTLSDQNPGCLPSMESKGHLPWRTLANWSAFWQDQDMQLIE